MRGNREVRILAHSASRSQHLLERVPRARRHVLAERLLDEDHEHGAFFAADVGAEHFAALSCDDARSIPRYWELGRRLWLLAQERDHALLFWKSAC